MIRYIAPVKPEDAAGLVASTYSQSRCDFGRIVEPFLLHSPLPELLAGVWSTCRETELVGNVPRSIKEAVAVAVSMQNRCPYCVDAHAIMLGAGGEGKLAKAILHGNLGEIEDAQTRGIVDWALNGTKTRFSDAEAAEIGGTAVYFHYMNRMANVFLGDTPLPSNRRLLRGGLLRVARTMFSPAVKRLKSVGDSLELLPEVELPADLSWASSVANVAGAFARFAKAVEIDGEYALPAEARVLVEREIGKSIAQKDKFTSAYAAKAAGALGDEAWRAAAQLALTAAVAPYRVEEETIVAFRRHYPEDTKLLGATAWASFTAARKIGEDLFA